MKLPSVLKRLTFVEIAVGVVFLLYIVLPVSTPAAMVPYIQSPISFIVIFIIILYLFLFSNPILAILYVGVAYMLLSRSGSGGILGGKSRGEKPPTLPVIPIPKNSRQVKDSDPRPTPIVEAPVGGSSAPPSSRTLEEDVISNMAPVGETTAVVNTTFRPVASNTNGASPAH